METITVGPPNTKIPTKSVRSSHSFSLAQPLFRKAAISAAWTPFDAPGSCFFLEKIHISCGVTTFNMESNLDGRKVCRIERETMVHPMNASPNRNVGKCLIHVIFKRSTYKIYIYISGTQLPRFGCYTPKSTPEQIFRSYLMPILSLTLSNMADPPNK